ncbi:NAD(+)/NADH kinase [Pseudonocardia asaccharolytica]|uniref:ATP-NAD kinase n=1 Tax=Pseudonocardia asaccharolytica DSM 44247 = NBRC 16224 TaxID=1123024 RepID=A0A511D3Y9_9PSEU|nr:NAD(+)/NADH kinase [Pseudonocardia asaccharolytica]GEL19506.1 ATP-NAD kinase [Pseudonocardia asaccharolytica DSM 44247 = NBRC 16224]
MQQGGPNGRGGAVATTLPVIPGSTIGIVANPMSGRDIRRLVAQASVFPNAEKTNMVLRLIAAAGGAGVDRVLMSTDAMGVAGGVLRVRDKRRATAGRWPDLHFVALDSISGTAEDTRALVRLMRERGASVIVLLGGDGTVRAASGQSGDVALLPLSTGTNNAFPEMWEATVAGAAVGLFATGRVATGEVTRRAKALHVAAGAVSEIALVDVCVSTVAHVGSKALWQPETLRELYCAFAEPHAIGLSSIAGLLAPSSRTGPDGVAVAMTAPARAARTVLAPIAPGVLAPIGIREARALPPGVAQPVALDRGTVAVDGEREIEFGPATPVTVTLAHDGPRVLDVRAVLAAAAARRLFVRESRELTQEIR